jgi:hypothetical protein
MENAMSSGWPDVLIRDFNGLHFWLELKIAHGRNARIRVRPEQIVWAETHFQWGGLATVFARCGNDHFWKVDPHKLREVSKIGCLSLPLYHMRDAGRVIMREMGYVTDVQPANSTLAEIRARLAKEKGRSSRKRADVPDLQDPWL